MAAGDIHVLHVDDEAVTDSAARELERDGEFRVTSSNSPTDALDRFDPTTYDCVVSGYEMPRIDGLELYDRLSSQFDRPDFPFILFVEQGSERVAADALNAGVTGYLRKGGQDQYDALAARIRSLTSSRRPRRSDDAADECAGALFDDLPDPTVVLDVEDGDSRIRRVNDAFERVFGYDGETAVGASVTELLPSPERDAEATSLDTALADGTDGCREVRRRTADGEWRDFLFRNVRVDRPDGDPLAYGIYTDITERMNYDRRLTELHETARRLMAAESGDAVLDVGLAAARDILGHDLNAIHLYDETAGGLAPAVTTEAIESLLDDVPTFTEDGESIAWNAYERGEARVCPDVRDDPDVLNPETPLRSEMVLPLGERGVLLLSSTEVDAFDDADVSLGSVLAATIQSALQQVEREQTLRERERALARQNERLDEFASIVSHDLRTPLDLASVHLELAVEGHDEEDHLERVEAAHDRMSRLIDDVLTWARDGEAVDATETVSVRSLVSGCWEALQTGDADLTVTTERAVEADRERLRRVAENLLDDALTHGGDAPSVRVGDLDDGSGVYVADDGPGIPEGERENVFDFGYTLSASGTGFGLAIVHQIIEAHGWEIRVAESEAGGARFEIRC
ncbi:ATP-binding protein [Haloarcula nitratireducens]|uniref:histidine kinase n=1 Tax=Haloarcula nitratireducens TaxID=2487749 RepID=A0AAW4P823_9EURY|nr:ATP-binding protein [Halomicroarcula nitratireducens]MBX0293918.1 PAS domain-containing protein [Halomicroarcula nitratireducens]